jgi:uncharacterized membrane protein YfcA
MTTVELIAVAGAVFVAALVQVLSGFGFALLSVPLMTLAVDTREAVVISTLLGMGVTTWQAWHLREHAVKPLANRLIAAAYVGMPLGLLVFITVDDRVLRLVLGVAVLVAVGLLMVRVDLSGAPRSFDLGLGFVSGVLNTSLSTNGPPLAFALQARQLQPDAFRATINRVFAFSNLVGVTLFLVAGKITAHGLLGAAVALPALFLGQACGYPLRRHVSPQRFRVLVLVLLVVAACSAIASALRG